MEVEEGVGLCCVIADDTVTQCKSGNIFCFRKRSLKIFNTLTDACLTQGVANFFSGTHMAIIALVVNYNELVAERKSVTLASLSFLVS